VLSRRAFLRAAGVGAVGALAGCTTTAVPSPTPTATATATPSLAPTATPTPRPAPAWDTLATKLRGSLIRPADDGYDGARVLYNTRFDTVRPQAIARCASVDDVRECIRFVRTFAIPIAPRSGGHSYGGWSTGAGLVLDVSPLDSVIVGDGVVTVCAGARLIDVYDAVAARGVGIAAGSCPTVGITGLTLGGGLGVLTRAWGLTCDDLVAAQVVTADAQVHDCDASTDADLFWALRGGGGGNFGIVTSLTLKTHAVGALALGFLSWPWARAAAVVAGWQNWMSRAPDALWSTLHLDTEGGGGVSIHAVHTGTAREISALLDGLVAATGAPSYRESGARTYRDVMLLEAGCLGRSVAQCHLQGTSAEGQLGRETYAGKSVVATSALSSDAIRALVEGVGSLAGRADVGGGAVLLDSLGGAVARVAPSATAFPHRDAFAVAQLIGSWDAAAPATVADATTTWLRQLHAAVRPLVGPGAYVNYADADLADWPNAYYGANYPRLRQIKARYDPDRLFAFPQAIQP